MFVELEPGDYVRTKAQQEFIRKKDARYQDKTDFVWLNFQYGTNLDFSVDKAVAVRLVYFCTAYGSDGVIQKCKLMDANLSLDKNQQTAFFKQALQSGLLRQEGSAFFINPQMMSWGEYLGDSDHIRIFSGYYRKLCELAQSQADLNRIYYFL